MNQTIQAVAFLLFLGFAIHNCKSCHKAELEMKKEVQLEEIKHNCPDSK